MKSQRFFLIVLAAICLAACSAPVTPTATRPPTATPAAIPSPTTPSGRWPTESWPTASLADENLDGERIENTLRAFATGVYGYIDHFALVRNGRMLVNERYQRDYSKINEGRDPTSHLYNYYDAAWHPTYQDTDLHTVQSVTKSAVSVLIGIAIQRGDLPGIDVRVLDYFEGYEIEELDERMGRITLEHLLTMRSGLDWDEWALPISDPENICIRMEASDDWIQFVLDLPMAHEPGEVWAYSSGGAQLLSVVVKQATGLHVHEYAEEHLFKPLGITEYYWKRTPKGWTDTEGGLYLKAEDLAKIGYLILNKGAWAGEQIVSEEWVEASTSPQVDLFPEEKAWDWDYGFLWWSIDVLTSEMPRIVFASGYGGQYLFIVPEHDLLTVVNAWNIYGGNVSLVDMFVRRILPAVD